MSLIIISDLHIKRKEPYLSAAKQFLNWVLENYPDDEIVQLGDLFDSSTIHSSVLYDIIDILRKFKKIHIITGNHDQSYRAGNILEPLEHYDNISVYNDITEIEIENNKCLMVPYMYDYKKYQDTLEGKYDFVFLHLMPTEFQFADEGVTFNKIKGNFIWGHHHIQENWIDSNSNAHCILGVPISTRHLEDQDHRILKITDGKIENIKVPNYFKFETIRYGETPVSTNNIINVIDAPNRKLVFEKYKDYYIREAGIKLLRTSNTEETFKKEFEGGNILDKFKQYSSEKALSMEVSECCSIRLSQII